MKLRLLFALVLFTTFHSFSQDKKWSVETNYPLSVGDGILLDNANGILDIGLKYRFVDLGFMI